MSGKYRGRREKMRLFRNAALAVAFFAAVSVTAVIVLGSVDNQNQLQEQETEPAGLIEVDGVKYIPKKNIETYLFMGIDEPGKVQKRIEYEGTGQCDVLILFVRDLSRGTFMTLPINRNTMTDVKSIDIDGTYLATTRNQIALAHSDGDGLEMSCENTVDAVSGLLHGQKIDGYAAVNMGAIEIINHLVGGVTVTIEDDFSQADPSMKMGETITLTDEQAVCFVRGRMNVGDGTNENRIRRQSQYLAELKPMLRQKCSEDSSFPLEIYESLEEYMVTDISAKKFSKIAVLAAKDKDDGELEITGTTTIGEMDFAEFEPDEDSLMQAILTLFYKKYE